MSSAKGHAPTGYREWMQAHGLTFMRRITTEGPSCVYVFGYESGTISVRSYEHGPGDPCHNPRRCGGGMRGWSPLDGVRQIVEMRLESIRSST